MLLIDYSSAFNTTVPSKRNNKLRTLRLNTSLCNWILDFLTGHPQVVRVGNTTSATLILTTGATQGCVLSPFLYALYTQNHTARHDSNTIKFSDGNSGRPNYRQQREPYREVVRDLVVWFQDNNLSRYVIKIILDDCGLQEKEDRAHTNSSTGL
jgi:hypothetical protein